MDIKEKEYLLKIANLEKQVKYLKSKLSNRKRLNNQKKKNNYNDDSSTDEDSDYFDDDISMEELENKSNDEINKVAKSIGINSVSNGNNKSEILKSIKNKINSKRIQRDKRMGIIAKRKSLLIIEMDNNEKLFWKIVRNKTLFKTLLSYLNTGSFTLKYDLLYDCQKLLNSGEIELLKYKVKLGDYLTNINLVEIFKLIKDDQKFYSNLFKNYSRILFNLNARVNFAVNNSCYGAIQVFIDEYEYKPTVEAIKQSIKSQSFKTFKCLLDYFKSSNSNLPLTDIEIWKLLFSSVDAVKDDIIDESKKKDTKLTTTTPNPTLKPVYNRYRNKTVKKEKKKEALVSKVSKFINYLIQVVQLPLPKLSKMKIQKLYQCPFYDNYTIGDTLNSCRSILLLELYSNGILTGVNTTFTSVQDLDITFSALTKGQLKQTVYEFFIENYLINQNTQIYSNIIKLLTMHYSVLGKTSLAYLILCLEADSVSIKKCFQTCKLNYYLECMYLDSFRFGEALALLNHPKANTPDYLITTLNKNYQMFPDYFNPQTPLFQFQIEKVKKIQFIRTLGESIRENKVSINIPEFLTLLVANDDLEILEFAYTQFGKPVWDIQKPISIASKDTFYFVKSIEILEYLIKNFFININTPIKPNSFVFNDRLDLLERYIQLLPSLVSKIEFSYYSYNYPIELFEVFKRILENPVISRYVDINPNHFQNFDVNFISLSKIINLLERYPKTHMKFNINIKKSPYFFVLANRWLAHQNNEDYKKRFLINRVHIYNEDDEDEDYNDYRSRYSRYSDYDEDGYPFDYNDIRLFYNSLSAEEGGGYMGFINNFMKVHFTLNGIEKVSPPLLPPPLLPPPRVGIVNGKVNPHKKRYGACHVKNNTRDDFGLLTILTGQARLGNLELFKSICSNGFKFIFKKENVSKKENKLQKFHFSSLELRDLFLTALAKDHLDLCLYLLDECGITIPDNLFNSNVKKNSVTQFNLINRFNFNFK